MRKSSTFCKILFQKIPQLKISIVIKLPETLCKCKFVINFIMEIYFFKTNASDFILFNGGEGVWGGRTNYNEFTLAL